MRLLIIEDEKDMALTLKETLRDAFVIDIATTATEGLHRAHTTDYDLITIDIGLPDMVGIDICKRIREENTKVPILIITATQDIDEKVSALDAGADDYLTKPFDSKELKARARVLLRRGSGQQRSRLLKVDSLVLDPAAREVMREGQTIVLRRKQFDLLEYLMRNQGKVLSRAAILEHVWDGQDDPYISVIDVHIKYLRDQIDRPFDKKLIKTVHGVGYKIDPNHEEATLYAG